MPAIEKKCKNCTHFNKCDDTQIGVCMNCVVDGFLITNSGVLVYMNQEFGCIFWESNCCVCSHRSRTVVSSPIDTADTCADCGKIVHD